jgi:hypothetical protein
VIHVAASVDVTSQIAWVEIEERDGAFYLFYFDSNGNRLTDTWHETVERAKAQARFEFEIEEHDWNDVRSNA